MKIDASFMKELDKEISTKAKELELLKQTRLGLQKLCSHDWVGDGHDSHHDWQKCRICGETEKC